MDVPIPSDATAFYQWTIGILLSTVLFITALIPGVKFLSKKLDERTDARIDAKLKPIVENICTQMQKVETAMQTHKAATDAAISAINDAMGFLQDLVSGSGSGSGSSQTN